MVPVVLSTASERLSIGYDLEVARRTTSRTRTSCIRCESRCVQGGEDDSTAEWRLGAGGRGEAEGQGFFEASSGWRGKTGKKSLGPLLPLLTATANTDCYCYYSATTCWYLLQPAGTCYNLLVPATCYNLLVPATCYNLLVPAACYHLPALALRDKHINMCTDGYQSCLPFLHTYSVKKNC